MRIYWPKFIVEVILLICLVLIPSVSIALFLVFVRLCCTPREFLILAHSSTPPGLKQLLDANTNTNANRNVRIIQFKNILILVEVKCPSFWRLFCARNVFDFHLFIWWETGHWTVSGLKWDTKLNWNLPGYVFQFCSKSEKRPGIVGNLSWRFEIWNNIF